MVRIALQDMTCADVNQWFLTLKFPKAAEVISSEQIDGEALIEFDTKDYTEIGIPESGEERTEFDKQLAALRENGYQKKKVKIAPTATNFKREKKKSLEEFFSTIGFSTTTCHRALEICREQDIDDVNCLLRLSELELRRCNFSIGMTQKLRKHLSPPMPFEEVANLFEKLRQYKVMHTKKLEKIQREYELTETKIEEKKASLELLQQKATSQKQNIARARKINSEINSLLQSPPGVLVSQSENITKVINDYETFQTDLEKEKKTKTSFLPAWYSLVNTEVFMSWFPFFQQDNSQMGSNVIKKKPFKKRRRRRIVREE